VRSNPYDIAAAKQEKAARVVEAREATPRVKSAFTPAFLTGDWQATTLTCSVRLGGSSLHDPSKTHRCEGYRVYVLRVLCPALPPGRMWQAGAELVAPLGSSFA
jgi:hypothetical protein